MHDKRDAITRYKSSAYYPAVGRTGHGKIIKFIVTSAQRGTPLRSIPVEHCAGEAPYVTWSVDKDPHQPAPPLQAVVAFLPCCSVIFKHLSSLPDHPAIGAAEHTQFRQAQT